MCLVSMMYAGRVTQGALGRSSAQHGTHCPLWYQALVPALPSLLRWAQHSPQQGSHKGWLSEDEHPNMSYIVFYEYQNAHSSVYNIKGMNLTEAIGIKALGRTRRCGLRRRIVAAVSHRRIFIARFRWDALKNQVEFQQNTQTYGSNSLCGQ